MTEEILRGLSCEHPHLSECCPPTKDKPGCGHFSCPDCGLFWDDYAFGDPEGLTWEEEWYNDPDAWYGLGSETKRHGFDEAA